jgi:uncharacterized protein
VDERDRQAIDIVRRFYTAEQDLAAPDIVWHVPGHNPVSGVYRGRQEYFEVMPARMAPLDTWDVTLGPVMVNGEVVVATFTMQGERLGRRIAMTGCHVFHLNAVGQIAEGWGFADDQEALDAFFAAEQPTPQENRY